MSNLGGGRVPERVRDDLTRAKLLLRLLDGQVRHTAELLDDTAEDARLTEARAGLEQVSEIVKRLRSVLDQPDADQV